MIEQYPDLSVGFKFSPTYAKEKTTLSGDEVFALGSFIHPEHRNEAKGYTIPEKDAIQPLSLDKFRVGQLIAIENMFTDSEDFDLYVVTAPYEVNSIVTDKYKLLPLDDTLDDVRVYSEEDEDEAVLTTKVGRLQPVNLYPVPDIIVAHLFGHADELVKRRI